MTQLNDVLCFKNNCEAQFVHVNKAVKIAALSNKRTRESEKEIFFIIES